LTCTNCGDPPEPWATGGCLFPPTVTIDTL
jgi:hypothetical protein